MDRQPKDPQKADHRTQLVDDLQLHQVVLHATTFLQGLLHLSCEVPGVGRQIEEVLLVGCHHLELRPSEVRESCDRWRRRPTQRLLRVRLREGLRTKEGPPCDARDSIEGERRRGVDVKGLIEAGVGESKRAAREKGRQIKEIIRS